MTPVTLPDSSTDPVQSKRLNLPIGIQTFGEIIQEGHCCVDKSGYAVDLARTGKAYFLSRPRRFGKSLFLDTLKELFEGHAALFAGIPHDWYRKNQLASFEGYYASIFYSYFAALGLDIRLEDTTHHGRMAMAVLFNGEVLLFEFKVVELTPKGAALQQLKDKGYADKYRARGEPIHLIGVEFSRDSRHIVGFEVETG